MASKIGWALAIGLAAMANPVWATAPDARTCPRPEAPDSGERERSRPLPVPAALRGVMGSSLYHYAVSTLAGGRICIDTSWTETADEHTISPDQRFVTFAWYGYESYGRKLIDRSGKGQEVEVGAAPVFSPSRRQFASVDQTESEFGAQSGFVVWRVNTVGVSEVARLDEIPRMYGWRIDGWAGEACLNLSAVPFDRMKGGDEDTARLPRDRFTAKAVGGAWRILLATGANRCPA